MVISKSGDGNITTRWRFLICKYLNKKVGLAKRSYILTMCTDEKSSTIFLRKETTNKSLVKYYIFFIFYIKK